VKGGVQLPTTGDTAVVEATWTAWTLGFMVPPSADKDGAVLSQLPGTECGPFLLRVTLRQNRDSQVVHTVKIRRGSLSLARARSLSLSLSLSHFHPSLPSPDSRFRHRAVRSGTLSCCQIWRWRSWRSELFLLCWSSCLKHSASKGWEWSPARALMISRGRRRWELLEETRAVTVYKRKRFSSWAGGDHKRRRGMSKTKEASEFLENLREVVPTDIPGG